MALQQSLTAQSKFSKETITKAIEQYVQANADCETKVSIQQTLQAFLFKESGVKAMFSHDGELRGLCKINISFLKNNETIESHDIRIKVNLMAQAPVANKFIAKNTEITGEDITITKTDVTQIDAKLIPDKGEIIGKKAKTGIVKGGIITKASIRSSEDVYIKKGSRVNILHYAGAICIKSTGFALQDGSVGDIIKVKKDNSNTLAGFIAEDGNIIIEDNQILGERK